MAEFGQLASICPIWQTVFMFRCFLLLFLLLLPGIVNAAWHPGFRTIGYHSLDPGARLDLNVWYPTTRSAAVLNYAPWQIRGALNAKPASGQFPLLILSHPSSGDRFSCSGLAAWLSARGFIVACPTHAHDNINNMDNLFDWKHMEERISEIEQVIEIVLRDQALASSADSERIGFIGFGAGATVGLLLGGSLPDCDGWKSYCEPENQDDVYCSDAAKRGLTSICRNLPLHKSLADARIKAMALISPGYGMLFGKDSFKYFYPPVLLVEAGGDQFNKPQGHTRPIGRGLGEKALYLSIPQADMGALMDECPELLRQELPELCLSVSQEERKDIRGMLGKAVYSFFAHYFLDRNNLPIIPAPPDITPVETLPAEPEKAKKNPGRKRAR